MSTTIGRPAGIALAAAGAVSYGVTVVVGRRLAASGLGPATALGLRFLVAAAILAALIRLRRPAACPLPGERLRLLVLGAVGYTTESTLFYLALGRGTAAACALLFYAYPAMVAAIEVARGRERPSPLTLAALGAATAGTVLTVASSGQVSISTVGVVLALGSALTYSLYLLAGRELGRRSDALSAACWLAIGAAMSSLGRGALTGGIADPSPYWSLLAIYGIATAAAFVLTFAALSRIGASRTAVVMTLEAFSAAVLGAVVLGEAMTPLQALGGLGVLAAAALIACSSSARQTTAPRDRVPAARPRSSSPPAAAATLRITRPATSMQRSTAAPTIMIDTLHGR